MSELRMQVEQAERALVEGRLDEADEEALDRLVLNHLRDVLKRKGVRDRLNQLQAEVEEMRRSVAELSAQNLRLKKERADLEAERDVYLKCLHAMNRSEFGFTPAELEELEKNGGSLEEVIQELEGAREVGHGR